MTYATLNPDQAVLTLQGDLRNALVAVSGGITLLRRYRAKLSESQKIDTLASVQEGIERITEILEEQKTTIESSVLQVSQDVSGHKSGLQAIQNFNH